MECDDATSATAATTPALENEASSASGAVSDDVANSTGTLNERLDGMAITCVGYFVKYFEK